jgi:ABC-type transport system involved in cytochrome c biogenesis permease subunit
MTARVTMSFMSTLLPGALILYTLGLVYEALRILRQRRMMAVLALMAIAVGFCAHTAWLVGASFRSGRFPFLTTQEVFAFLAWAIIVYYFLLQARRRTGILRLFIFPVVLAFLLVAVVSSRTRPLPEPLEELLRMPALPLHVAFMMFAYAAFFLAFVAATMYLVQERELKRKRFGAVFQLLPSLSTCEALSSRSLLVGFLLLTSGIGMGVILLRRSDPIFWRGDPIIILAVLTWVLYLIVIHYRLMAGWRGRKAAILLILGFAVTAVTFLWARLFGHII